MVIVEPKTFIVYLTFDSFVTTRSLLLVTPINTVDVGSGSTAAGYGVSGSGLEFLMIKYQNVFVLITAWYSHPQKDYVALSPLGITIAERLNNYAY